ncbi:hypothetical protein PVAP13_3KG246500 [Panicum virgatum]|uniref:Uncharacterized protein n=1 Tax=Panicum virgatum TaxID=38727 RepID=A0A8T0V1U0_PANVG|nr:hypothetical protein PVAP13_3KG246500 [Panicum virgatum]KAG2628407.1 hypothetical protein PVAP13_3KG246500 [Panicum virgatum]
MGMALCSLVRLSQISGAPSHRRSTWCRHQPADGKAHLAYILCVSAVQTTVAVKGAGCTRSRSRCKDLSSSQHSS